MHFASTVKRAPSGCRTVGPMREVTHSFYVRAVIAATKAIREGLDDALDLAALGKKAALSPLHFHHVFRGLTGETPLGMHRRLRLERAAYKLATTDVPVTVLAYEAGYETHESFTRAFRSAYDASPTDHRRRAKSARKSGRRGPPLELTARTGVHFGDPTPVVTLPKLRGGGDVTIEALPRMVVATVHHRGPYPTIFEAFGRLGAIAGPAGLFTSRSKMIALYHDDPEAVSPSELRSDAGITVDSRTKLPSALGRVVLPKGRYARTTHRGPYERLGDTWSRLMGAWLPASEHRVRKGPSFEIYRNDPETTKPNDRLTDVYVPIR